MKTTIPTVFVAAVVLHGVFLTTTEGFLLPSTAVAVVVANNQSRDGSRPAKNFTTTTTLPAVTELSQYAPDAIALFNNMKTPASILGGAIVGLGFGSPLDVKSPEHVKENNVEKFLRKSYLLVAAISLLSHLVAIMWATVAVNKLTELHHVPKAKTVWDLLQRDYDLSWAGVNAHFMLGMLAFSYIIGVRGYFMAGRGLLGQSVAGIAVSSLLFMIGLVNRGIAEGGGTASSSYGKSIVDLFTHYFSLLIQKNQTCLRPLEIISFLIGVFSFLQGIRGIWTRTDYDQSHRNHES